MFGSSILEVAIGLVFVYLLLSLICTTANELIAALMTWRAINLEQGIRNLLNDPSGNALAKVFAVTPLSNIKLIIQNELGYRTASRLQFAARALAEASVAVVVPFCIPEQKAAKPIEGVLKVLKPGIAERLEEELEPWSALAPYLDGRCAHYHLPSPNYADTLEAVKALFVNMSKFPPCFRSARAISPRWSASLESRSQRPITCPMKYGRSSRAPLSDR